MTLSLVIKPDKGIAPSFEDAPECAADTHQTGNNAAFDCPAFEGNIAVKRPLDDVLIDRDNISIGYKNLIDVVDLKRLRILNDGEIFSGQCFFHDFYVSSSALDFYAPKSATHIITNEKPECQFCDTKVGSLWAVGTTTDRIVKSYRTSKRLRAQVPLWLEGGKRIGTNPTASNLGPCLPREVS